MYSMKENAALLLLALLAAAVDIAVPLSAAVHLPLDDAEKDAIRSAVNGNQNRVPAFVASTFGGKDVAVHIDDGQDYTVALSGTHIRAIQDGVHSPDIHVRTDRATAEQVINSAQPVHAYRQAKRDGSITIEATSAKKQIRQSDNPATGALSAIANSFLVTVANLFGL